MLDKMQRPSLRKTIGPEDSEDKAAEESEMEDSGSQLKSVD